MARKIERMLSLLMSHEMHKDLKKMCADLGVGMSEFIRDELEHLIIRHKKNKNERPMVT